MTSQYDECLKKGMLRPIPPDPQNSESSMAKAKEWIVEAEKALKGEALKASLYSSYMAMFHASRAVLYRDGLREKSHYCIARYLEAEYVEKGKLEKEWVELLDFQRETRHSTQYDVAFQASEDDDSKAIDSAKRFVKRIGELLKK